MKTIFISIILLFTGLTLFAQEKSSRELKGDKHFFVYAFDDAIDSYEGTKELTSEGQRRLAESYANINRNIEAEEAYARLVNMPASTSEDIYKYAMVLKANGKYSESQTWMDKFASQQPNDLRAQDYLANRGALSDLSANNGRFSITELDMNTEASDFGTAYYKDKIVFSSSRSVPKFIARKYNWNDQPYLDIFVADVKNGQLENPENFSKALNGKLHDGPVSFSNNDTYVAYTRNNYDNERKDKIVECQLYFSNYKDGKWEDEIPFHLNGHGYSVGHPSLTEDGNTMYFASDMPGGYGGVDLYRVNKDSASGNWGPAENLGNRVNTEGDEMFPFYLEKNNILFFASNGRYGLGGLDIFIYEIQGGSYGRVYNAGAPLNSQYDDFALILNDDATNGYVSSNRSGGEGDDDIYGVNMLVPFDIQKRIVGIAKDQRSNPLAGTFVTIKTEDGLILETFTTKEDGAYSFMVDSDKRYELTGEKENYVTGNTSVNTSGSEEVIYADVILRTKEDPFANENEGPIEDPDLETVNVGDDLGEAMQLRNIYFDLDKYYIRSDAEDELNMVAKIMNENPNMVILLTSHADCRASVEYNQALSEKRAQASAAYLKKRVTKPERIQSVAYGETKHVTNCYCEGDVISYCEEPEFQKDRRTEFRILQK